MNKVAMICFSFFVIYCSKDDNSQNTTNTTLYGLTQEDIDQALMIGDAECDMQMAVSIGMMGIGVETGGGTGHQLKQAGADIILNDVTRLFNLL